jgi:hypothetical protein
MAPNTTFCSLCTFLFAIHGLGLEYKNTWPVHPYLLITRIEIRKLSSSSYVSYGAFQVFYFKAEKRALIKALRQVICYS